MWLIEARVEEQLFTLKNPSGTKAENGKAEPCGVWIAKAEEAETDEQSKLEAESQLHWNEGKIIEDKLNNAIDNFIWLIDLSPSDLNLKIKAFAVLKLCAV